MKRNILILLSIIATLFLSHLQASSQTFRICTGVSPHGVQNYIEVYEYDYVYDKPVFPGGDSQLLTYVNSTREYPAEAYRKGVEGRVTCSFIVNANGSISHVAVLRGVEESLDKEAIRILSTMPDWTPGRIYDRAVPVRVIYSVPFRK